MNDIKREIFNRIFFNHVPLGTKIQNSCNSDIQNIVVDAVYIKIIEDVMCTVNRKIYTRISSNISSKYTYE